MSQEPQPDIIDKNFYIYTFHPVQRLEEFVTEFGQTFLTLALLYLPFIHLPDLLNTIGIVSSSSAIYSGDELENKPIEALIDSFENGVFKRSMITSMYVLLMSSLVYLGFLAIASQACVYLCEPFSSIRLSSIFVDSLTWSSFMFVLPFIVLLYKYLQWSSLWNLGTVTWILEEKHGDVALGVSAYISRGNRVNGQVVTMMFCALKVSLRLMATVYAGFHQDYDDQRRVILFTAFQVFLVCFANVVKWVFFMVFFYDCEVRFLEKKVDVEEGKKDSSPVTSTSLEII